MTNTMNGYRYAELARGESLCSPEVCDCCGREGLKKTVKLVAPGGSVVWYGVGCAAKAIGGGLTVKDVRAARKAQIDADTAVLEEERKAKLRAQWLAEKAEDDRFQAWLDANGPATVPSTVLGERAATRFDKIDALGGWTKARELYKAANP